jgi:hypothetical protein
MVIKDEANIKRDKLFNEISQHSFFSSAAQTTRAFSNPEGFAELGPAIIILLPFIVLYAVVYFLALIFSFLIDIITCHEFQRTNETTIRAIKDILT